MFKKKKFLIIFMFTCLLGMELIAMIPTFSKLKTEENNTSYEWDKSIANSFNSGTGTIDDPYIISNASELAYLSKALETTDFEDKYVKLNDDIIINKGFFKDGDVPLYIDDDNTYYLNKETNDYYLEANFENKKDSVNEFLTLDGFKGHFDGNYHTIYGLYLKGDNIALFTNFSGDLSNLFIDNAYIIGNYEASGVVLESKNAKLKNIIFNGNVIGKKNTKENILTNTIPDIVVNKENKLDLDIPLITSNTYSFILKGTCTGDNEVFKINNQEINCNNFEVEVNPYNINISAQDTITLTNLEYTFSYNTNLASGIVSRSYNTVLNGLVNKGNIKNTNASGIVGVNYNSNISNSYNIGKIIGDNTSGIINMVIYSNIALTNVYNNNILDNNSAGLINNIESSNVSIINSFNTYKNPIGSSNLSTIIVDNSYNAETFQNFNTIDIETINNLYPAYINQETIDEGNIWILKDYPVLYFDDLNSKYVNIKLDNHIWDSYHNNLNSIDFDNDISILLTSKKDYNQIKNVYYYLSNDILTEKELNDLEWLQEYTGLITIKEKGSYILYVKVVDYNDNNYYLNTDRLNLNIEEFYANITTNGFSWTTYHDPEFIYVDSNLEYSVSAFDKKSDIKSIEYLVSDKVLDIEDLNNITDFNIYQDKITVTDSSYILYIKIVSNDDTVHYINTDIIINKSYSISNIKSGNNMAFNSNMTYNSSFNFDINLNHNYLENMKLDRYLKTNNKLPENTLIIIKDQITKNVYKYVTNDDDTYNSKVGGYIYSLSNFESIGKMTFINKFDNSYYTDKENESFNINISFENIKPTQETYTLSFIAASEDTIINTSNPVTISLLNEDTNINNYLNINSSYIPNIIYNTEYTTSIPINVALSNDVLNTNYENMHQGIAIELVDINNKKIEAINYKGIKFNYNGNIYTPNKDSITLIDLGTNYNQDIILDIITSIDQSFYITGTYYFKITSYLSKDSKLIKYKSKDSILIPIEFTKDYTKLDYSFNVSLNNLVINKENNRVLNFKIIESGNLVNPNIRVSLYKKKELTAYNQEYVSVDLNDYIEDKLNGKNSIYDALKNPISYDNNNSVNNFNITLNENIENNGYKFIFQLYDGDNLVGNTSVKVVVR